VDDRSTACGDTPVAAPTVWRVAVGREKRGQAGIPSNAGEEPDMATQPAHPQPTIVLVHGAWADASGFAGVIRALQDRGFRVVGFMAERAHARIQEVAASHAAMVSQPDAATRLILQAAEATSPAMA
jgi:alpha-beta hydrolase superfamily lysophospholipase